MNLATNPAPTPLQFTVEIFPFFSSPILASADVFALPVVKEWQVAWMGIES